MLKDYQKTAINDMAENGNRQMSVAIGFGKGKTRIQQLDEIIIQCAKEFLKEPICPANMQYHNDILDKQCEAIREWKELKKEQL